MKLARRLRLWAVNGLIGAVLTLVLIDALPMSPPALKAALQPITYRLGLRQDWGMFAPAPDSLNLRLRAEITYADGQKAMWRSPDWPQLDNWQRFVGHRHEEWYDQGWGQQYSAIWPSWARQLARQMRPGDPHADRGAEVKFIVEESPTPPADQRPWRGSRVAGQFDQSWVLTTEKLP
ncbi:MAG: hypothetical protein SFU86_21015 [Pirellulaceae bacterium]|nr:hypothetical protein [Pirellulaceae bacterium]